MSAWLASMSTNEQRPVPVASGDGAVLAGAEAHVVDGAAPLVLDQAFDSGTLYALRAAAQAHAIEAGLAEDRTDDLVISVHELAANAVRHGAGRGRLRMWQRDGALHCQVEDAGSPATAGQAPGGGEEEARPGAGHQNATAADETPEPDKNVADRWPFLPGHGLWLVRLVSDQLSLSSGPDGSWATIVFSLSPDDPSVSSPG
jgi:anti-sigma regulatory factor (Ser/Thr protein kinase)